MDNINVIENLKTSTYCFMCYEVLDENHICWNTNFEGAGVNCPTYGIPQE